MEVSYSTEVEEMDGSGFESVLWIVLLFWGGLFTWRPRA